MEPPATTTVRPSGEPVTDRVAARQLLTGFRFRSRAPERIAAIGLDMSV
jgi:hypothetical protein